MFNAPTTAITNAQKNATANIKPLTLSLMMPSFVWFSNKKQLYPSIPNYVISLAYIINNCQALYSTARKKIHQWQDKLRMGISSPPKDISLAARTKKHSFWSYSIDMRGRA
jgi:hypothetical protein